MEKVIVTTTINPPTQALIAYSQLPDWHLIVIGDTKTPHDAYSELNCTYLRPEQQQSLFPEISEAIGWNCIQRRNIGFLFALKIHAELIATVDDDNIPNADWGMDIKLNQPTQAKFHPANEKGWFDPIYAAGEPSLWHRGYPIQFLTYRTRSVETRTIVPDVQANFWNGDPDIDAVCRMEHAPNIKFDSHHFPFFSDGMAPFNSQNTILTRRALRDYFMFPDVGRMDDIWAAFYMVASGYSVLFDVATVFQERNEHDLTLDFSREILGYENNYLMADDLRNNPENLSKYVPMNSWDAFNQYREISYSL